ncbi:hypothetical protein JAAARDRAFT_211652 [Jaapia argillacea MUCL 33604]|uniref:F-box domain-containing protein n=1 Tax=Jaapia argillacea MUCL 33604 TaxID=933084 RepID=A0A067P6V3_9AGAM|nr:hypothetical protein JAAARDRAFT_211652 [Jaapia argillacea MUCL 33604]
MYSTPRHQLHCPRYTTSRLPVVGFCPQIMISVAPSRLSLAALPYEIRLEVFRNLPGDIYQQRPILANIASTCRALSDPALDLLWHTMIDIEHLLILIPRVQIDRRSYGPYTTYHINGPIQPSAWRRFDSYAKRIRVLEYARPSYVLFILFADLGQYRPGPLLPNLRQLSWDDVTQSRHQITELGHILLSFPTHSLREVTVAATYVEQDDTAHRGLLKMADLAQRDFLPRLASNAPMVRCLTLSGYMPNLLLETLPEFSSLTDLTMSDLDGVLIDGKTFRALSCLAALSTLSVDLRGVAAEALLGWTGFPSLQSFTLDGTSVDIAAAVISTISSTLFNNVCIKGSPRATVEESRHLFTRLRNFKHTLATVSLTFDELTSPSNRRYPLTDIIESLLDLHRMLHLQIISHQPNAVLVTDDCMDKMAVAWPGIKTLDLLFGYSQPGITVRGLTAFAQKCPSLCDLCLDAIDFLHRVDLGTVPLSKSCLRSISFRRWLDEAHIDENENVLESFKIAQAIDRLYPDLSMSYFSGPAMIENFIRGLQAARCDERRRLRADTVESDEMAEVAARVTSIRVVFGD